MSSRQVSVGADQLQPESLSGGGAGNHIRRRHRQPLPVQEARRAVPAQHQSEIVRIHLAFRLRSGRRSKQAWLERAEQTTTKQTRSRRVVGLVSRRVAIPRVRAQRRCRREAGRVLPHVHRGAGAVVGRDRVQPACGADRSVSASSSHLCETFHIKSLDRQNHCAPEPRLPARPRLKAALHRRHVLIPHPAAVERRAWPALWVAEAQAEREGRFVPHGSRGRCVACVGLSLRRRRMQPAENSRRMLLEAS